MNNILEIPKNLIKEKKLVIVPKREYDEFLQWRKAVKFFIPTYAQKRELRDARADYKKGKYIRFNALKRKLATGSKR
jgi:5-formaminoimidazole-4-carboxamide-1-beta-D-ribofuranosyl 5'-monophosphate synthetase